MCLPNLLLVGYVFANYLAIHQGFAVVALNYDYLLYRISLLTRSRGQSAPVASR